MGQKVHPHGVRVGVIKDWDSKWYAGKKDFGSNLVEDFEIRKYLKKSLFSAGIAKIEIERNDNKVRVHIHTAKPGVVIGKGGAEKDKIKAQVEKLIGKNVIIDIVEVKNAEVNAQLVAENIAAQLERRISFRRAMKQVMQRAMKMGAKGIKTCCSGRLGGAEIARSEHYHEGTIPLQTLRADIEYGFAEADTTYGKIGVKVWLYKGEVLTGGPRQSSVEAPRRDRRERRDGDRRNNNRNGDRRQGGNRNQGDRKPQGNRPFRGGNRPAPKQEGGAQ